MTKTGKRMPGRGEPFAEPNPPPASDPGRRREGGPGGRESVGATAKTEGPGLEGPRVITHRLPQERGGRGGFGC